LAAFWNHFSVLSDLIVPTVFFFGACFVRLTSDLSLQTAIDVKRVTLLEQENIIDPLTGICNRRCMERRLREEFARAQRYAVPLAIILLDIDYFKHVNDTHGHQSGDLVLTQLGKLISQGIRDSDIAARYGGEEFLIIASNTTALNAVTLASRLRQQIESYKFMINNDPNRHQAIHITASFGIADFGREVGDVKTLVSRADEALYRAKHEGRNRVIVSSDSV
jgi:diguanylate cyclase (GGDEF)-like protein